MNPDEVVKVALNVNFNTDLATAMTLITLGALWAFVAVCKAGKKR